MPLVGIPFCGRLFPQVESALGFLVTLASARTFRFLAVFAQSGSGEQLSATFRLSFPPLSLSLSLGSSSFSLFVFVWKGNEIEIPFRSRSRSWLRQLGGRAVQRGLIVLRQRQPPRAQASPLKALEADEGGRAKSTV